MKLTDIIIALFSGEAVAIIFSDLLRDDQILFSIVRWSFLFIVPAIAVAVYWFLEKYFQRFIYIMQFAKYALIGILATLVDLKIFAFFGLILGADIIFLIGVSKTISFLIATGAKFLGNKYWTFEENNKEGMGKEFIGFLLVTFMGLVINVVAYFFFVNTIGPHFGFSIKTWSQVSVILAVLASAIINFLGYKLIIFKK